MANTVLENNCTCIELPFAPKQEEEVEIKVTTKEKKHKRTAKTKKKISKQRSASWFREEDLNRILEYLFNNGKYMKANLLVFGCNVGFRAGDIISLRVKDFLNDDGSIANFITIEEQKTGKLRTVWLNETVRKMLAYTINNTSDLEQDDFLFQSGERKKAFVEEISYDEFGDLDEFKTTFEQYDDNCCKRRIAPMSKKGITGFFKDITRKFNIEGKYSTHSMRQTFARHISIATENADLKYACESFGHSSMKVTLEHYNGVDTRELKERMLNLNLGKQVIDNFLEGKNVQEIK